MIIARVTPGGSYTSRHPAAPSVLRKWDKAFVGVKHSMDSLYSYWVMRQARDPVLPKRFVFVSSIAAVRRNSKNWLIKYFFAQTQKREWNVLSPVTRTAHVIESTNFSQQKGEGLLFVFNNRRRIHDDSTCVVLQYETHSTVSTMRSLYQ